MSDIKIKPTDLIPGTNITFERGRVMSIKQAASWLGVSEWNIRQRIWAGDLPVVRFPGGRKQYIEALDIYKMVKANKTINK